MAAESFVNFESGHVRPLALSPSRTLLFAVNTPDNRLEIFRITANGLESIGETVVGLEPVAVVAASDHEIYVVNHLSDSVSVVDASDPSQPFVRTTLLVGDEPRDLVVAGARQEKLFVTTAHRGQSRPDDPQLITPGVGRADVWVFDRGNLAAEPDILTLFADTPRALAVTADGERVYAAAFHSGNQTTALDTFAVSRDRRNTTINDGFIGLGIPEPTRNRDGIPAPDQSLIVKFDGEAWRDAVGRDWSARVRFNLPDQDVFEIDATQSPPSVTQAFSGVGTVLFNMAVHPQSGDIYVSNLEAQNHIRFEPDLRGHITESRVTILASPSEVKPVHLNPHIDYNQASSAQVEREQSLAFPMHLVFAPDGATLYVAAFGSSTVGVLTAAGEVVGRIRVGGGPSGLALDAERERLYVMNRFDQTISIVNTQTQIESQAVPLRYNPEPDGVRLGRPLLYEARLTSGHGDSACASCHIFGGVDSLAWNLGDPDGGVEPNPLLVPEVLGAGPIRAFHPLKGPMVTQSLRGLLGAGPMHWRGDRNGGNDAPLDEEAAFMAFRPAFQSLLGRETELSLADMNRLGAFVFSLRYPPNPVASIDGTLTRDQQAGKTRFERVPIPGSATLCISCHASSIGTTGRGAMEGFAQDMKSPHLRNLYQKVGMFGYAVPSVSRDLLPLSLPPILEVTPTPHMGDQVRGFGFEHDGTTPTLHNFFRVPTGQFPFPDEPSAAGDQQVRELTAFLLAFDTGLAAVVGQQVTLTAATLAVALPRHELLQARAEAGDCDLVVHGLLNGQTRGWVYVGSGRFQADREDEFLTDEDLVQAVTVGAVLTTTAVPPGSGQRMGIDRDQDGALNRDELDAEIGLPMQPNTANQR